MRDSIVLSVSDLLETIQLVASDGLDTVELAILDSELDSDGELMPAELWISGFHSSDPSAGIDYESLSEVTHVIS
jgi:hypothetical protein